MAGKKISALLLLSLFLTWFFLLLQSCMQSETGIKETAANPDSLSGEVSIPPSECRPCHQAIVDSFFLTGKGRSLLPALAGENLCRWDDVKPVYDSHRDLYYLPEKSGKQFFIREFRLENGDTIHLRREGIHQVVGSGNQTVSFFRLQNGYLWEMPLTWYRKKAIWDLSPGYENGNNHGFDRAIGSECLECHASGFREAPQSGNRFLRTGTALSCETCHGSMDKHLTKMKTGSKRDPEVMRLSSLPSEIQMDVCRRCHLEGIKISRDKTPAGNFRPGKRFSDYFEVFIPKSETGEFGFASHSERLQMSNCFVKSSGKMNCSSCHNSHEPLPADRNTYFNNKCQSCHLSENHGKECSGNNGKATCISCHMQRGGTSDIPHVSSTDHWIRKNPALQKTTVSKEELQNFAGKNYSRSELARAWLFLAETRGDSLSFTRVQDLLPYLPPASLLSYHYLKKLPGIPKTDTSTFSGSADAQVVFRWAEVKRRAGLPWYTTLERACRLAPDRIEFLFARIISEEECGKKPDYSILLRLNPLHPEANSNFGFEALQQGNYAEAEMLLKKSLQGNPDKILARENLARCYVESGKFAEAKKELMRLQKMKPGESRYAEALRSLP